MRSLQSSYLTCSLLSISLSGCIGHEPDNSTSISEAANSGSAQHYIAVQPYGRYTLVELEPHAGQRDLLLQVIDIDMPSTWSISVEDALRYALLRSGYRLCERSTENAPLFDLPLPAVHLRLGPILLRDALQVLAGPAWALQTNEQLRQACFIPTPDSVAKTNAKQAPVSLEINQ
ncbi:hypothetical protein D3C73_665570 [compost metagenome]